MVGRQLNLPIDNKHLEPCKVCGYLEDDCICPQCPKCHEVGDPRCYMPKYPRIYRQRSRRGAVYERIVPQKGHGLRQTTEQAIGCSKRRISNLADQLDEAWATLTMLEHKKLEEEEMARRDKEQGIKL
jgi:hypothetical protein